MFTNQPEPADNSAANAHIMKEIDEIKRYVAGIYDKVDSEIEEIRALVREIDRNVRDNDRQLDKMERYEQTIKNIENMCRNMERKIK